MVLSNSHLINYSKLKLTHRLSNSVEIFKIQFCKKTKALSKPLNNTKNFLVFIPYIE